MVNAIILAAGEGTRLRPHTLDRPKCMVEIDGKSLIDRQLNVLDHPSINDVVIIGGYKVKMLEGKADRVKENTRYFETNMVWTLFSAEEELNGDIIVSYGDIVFSREILQSLLDSKFDISVIIDKERESYWCERNENPLDDAESLKLRDDGTIIEIGQKPNSLQEIQGQYIGLMKFSSLGLSQVKKVFHAAKESGKLMDKPLRSAYMTDLLQAMIEQGVTVNSLPISGGWVEVDTVGDLKSVVTSARLSLIENTHFE